MAAPLPWGIRWVAPAYISPRSWSTRCSTAKRNSVWSPCAPAAAWGLQAYSNYNKIRVRGGGNMGTKVIRKGGAFFLEDVPAKEVFTPEDLSEEHEMIASTTQRFIKNEVRPNAQRLEHKDWALNRQLLLKAGELGLLGADIEEKYGGSEMGITASIVIGEDCAPAGSFGLTLNDHTGTGSPPLILC